MAPAERDAPREPDRALRHQHSASSDHGRALVPMWDSSDPERAPPPLPLHPQSPSFTSRSGTSTAIQSAHAALTERAREHTLVPTLSKRMSEASSPERPVSKGSTHRRMQSLQPGTVRDRSLMLEGGTRESMSSAPRSPEKSDRPSTPLRNSENSEAKGEGKDDDKALVASPRPNSAFIGPPPPWPSTRRSTHQSILGENTPPQSATMLALQNLSTPSHRDQEVAPLSNVTNGSNALIRAPQSFDSLSNQILSLTNIATSLQKEMSQLSRRSRDNATDLMSLKDATHARDEDIRKSLRELVYSMPNAKPRAAIQDSNSSYYLPEPNSHSTSPLSVSKTGKISLPRIPSPTSFSASLDRESMSTPSLYGTDTPATIALLEKILREMGTREGQDMLLSRLSDLADELSGMASAEKVDELRRFVQSTRGQSLVATAGAGGGNGGGGGSNGPDRSYDSSPDDGSHGPHARGLSHAQSPSSAVTARVERLLQDKESRRSSVPSSSQAVELVNEDILKIIKTVKDSVAQGGGLTAEVKALVRELRGEVLGMGREIGRRLDGVAARPADGGADAKDETTRVIQEGLSEMKQHITDLVREHRRQSAASATSRASSVVDYNEIYNALRAALQDSHSSNAGASSELSRQDVVQAVKDAWENYKPEIEIEQLGLERDEILTCLKEGLQSHAAQANQHVGATRDEVFAAVVEGLKHFVPPQIDTPANLSRDEILDAVRECLEEFEFPVAPSAIGTDFSKEDMADAVKEGLKGFEFPSAPRSGAAGSPHLAREDVADAVLQGLQAFDFPVCQSDAGTHLSREAIADAVRESLQGFDLAAKASDLGSVSAVSKDTEEEIVSRLHELMDFVREEFKTISEEAKQNTAKGADVEQVLGATRDGFHKLHADIESLAQRAAANGAAGQAEPAGDVVQSLEAFRQEIADLVAKNTDTSRQMLRTEVDSLRDAVNSWLVPTLPHQTGNREILEALREGLTSLRADIGNRPLAGVGEILDALNEGMGDLRTSIEKLHNKPADLSANDEILEALKSGLDGVRSEIGSLGADDDQNDRSLVAKASGGSKTSSSHTATHATHAMLAANILRHDDIKNLEVLIAQVRAKVEALDDHHNKNPSPQQQPVPAGLSKEDLAEIEETLRNVQASVVDMTKKEGTGKGTGNGSGSDNASREDIQAVETILRNTKARLDDLIDGEQAVRKEHVDELERLIIETRDNLGGLSAHLQTVSHKKDITAVESLVTQIVASFDDMQERQEKALEDPEKVTKTDVDAIETTCLEIRALIEQVVKADLAGLPSKDDLAGVERLVKESRDKISSHAEASAKATEERQAETVGVGMRVDEVKSFLEELRSAVTAKLEEGAQGIDSAHQLLDAMNETLEKNATVGDDLRELFVTMKDEFQESKAGVVGAKLEADEKFQQTTEVLSSKFEERIGELKSKYDEFQLTMEERAAKGEARDLEIETAAIGTKAAADDLKSLADTLGSAVTDSLEKMEEASKTVFNRVEDLAVKADENHTDGKAEHRLTRDHVGQAVGVVEELLQGRVVEYQPKILDAVKEVLLLVGQHYEHAKSSAVDIRAKIEEAKPPEPPPLLPPAEKYDDTVVHEKLDKLAEHARTAGQALAQLGVLDAVHQQVQRTATEISDLVASQTQRIEDEHEDREKVLQETTVLLERRREEKEQLDAIVAGLKEEAERLANGRRQDEERARQANVAEEERVREAHKQEEERFRNANLEEEARFKGALRAEAERSAQAHLEEEERFRQSLRDEEDRLKKGLRDEEERFKESLREEETRFKASLRDEEQRLKLSIAELQAEQEGLARHKMRLAADVSSIETALHLRREELHEMEARAEGLERRILEGVMDHSRVLLMANAGRTKGRETTMSRKRVPSHKGQPAGMAGAGGGGLGKASAAAPDPHDHNAKPRTVAFNMALSNSSSSHRNHLAVPANSAAGGGQGRRILSLSQINSNSPSGAVKRSQSVRTPAGAGGGLRKSSWAGGVKMAAAKRYGELTETKDKEREEDRNKENMELKESDEERNDLAVADVSRGALTVIGGAGSEVAVVAENEPGGPMPGPMPMLLPAENSDGMSDTETLRRSSQGTSSGVTATESYTSTDYEYSSVSGSGDEEEGDTASEWAGSGVDGSGGNEVTLYTG